MEIDLDDLFYKNYPTDFHIYLATILKNILNNPANIPNLLTGIETSNQEEVVKSIKSQIRAMYFQSIETLFELIFAIERILKSKNISGGMWYHLSKSPYRENYDRIAKKDFSFLDEEFTIEDLAKRKLKVSLAHYVFFFNFNLNQDVINSIEAIKYGLNIFANDFSDRDEYNAFKHSLRVFPTIKSLKLIKKISQETNNELEMKESVSYLNTHVQDGVNVALISKALDTERDFNLTLTSSSMISNIIKSRKSVKLKKQEFIYYFDKKDIGKYAKPKSNLSAFRLNFK